MKKNLLNIFCATMLITMGVCADTFAQFGIAAGPKAGVSITTFRGTNVENIDNRTSWLGGLFLNAQITPAFALQPEVLLSRKGAEFVSNGMRRNITIRYFEVPVLVKLRLPISDVVFPHILLGPNFAFRTNLDYSSYDTDAGTTVTTNDNDIRKSDVGALVGAGIDIQTRGSGLFFTIDGRYGFGFNNINRADDTIELRNTGWSFAAGLGFLLTRE